MPNFDQEIEINIGTNDNPVIIKYPTPIEGLGSSSKETLAWLEVAKKAVERGESPSLDSYFRIARSKHSIFSDPNFTAAERFSEFYGGNYTGYIPFGPLEYLVGQHMLKQARELFLGGSGNGSSAYSSSFSASWGFLGILAEGKPEALDEILSDPDKAEKVINGFQQELDDRTGVLLARDSVIVNIVDIIDDIDSGVNLSIKKWDELINVSRELLQDLAGNGETFGKFLWELHNNPENNDLSWWDKGWIATGGLVAHLFGWGNITDPTNNAFNDAQNFVPRRDPLTLDLNNNGIETLGVDVGVTFDFDGDGIKTGTGWVAATDGLLVYDRDGNGTIDNGGELFGVDTVKADGTKATDGFDALRDLDSNGDGVFDRNDELFSKVQVWQDLNGDGISQANELKTLEEIGIAGVNLNASKTSIDSNGNLISAVGSFIWADGSTGELNGNQSVAANLDLADNPFYREFADKIELDEISKALPKFKGSGAVRDLQEATMLSAELKNLMGQYAVATIRDEQLALLDSVIFAWSKTADFKTFDEKVTSITVNGKAIQFGYSWELNHSQPTAAQLKQKEFLETLKILEIFNAQGFVSYQLTTNKEGQPQLSIKVGATSYLVDIDPNNPVITEQNILVNGGQMGFLMQSYQHIRDSLYDGLLLSTRLKDYVSSIEMVIKEDQLQVDYAGFNQFANEQFATRPIEALKDLLDFNRVYGERLHALDSNHLSLIREWLVASQDADFYPDLIKAVKDFNFDLTATGTGGYGADLLISTKDGDTLFGGAGDDLIIGGDGDDFIRGGAGNDQLYGGKGNDTYFFELGGGADIIMETQGSTGTDTLLLSEGIQPGDITIVKEGNHLVLRLSNGRDSITIQNWFNSLNDKMHRLDLIQFADGRVYNLTDLKLGTEKGETLESLLGNGILIGGAGDDILKGSDQADWLDGGTDHDVMMGGKGNDTYIVDSAKDVVIEEADGGIDTVESKIDYVLGDHVENLTLLGHQNLSGQGNELDNIIRGNDGSNHLKGMAGNDMSYAESAIKKPMTHEHHR